MTASRFATVGDLGEADRVAVRIDINSPIEDGTVTDNRRFEAHSETIATLCDQDRAIALLAHQGRPGRDDFGSLAGHTDVLERHLGTTVRFVEDVHGSKAQSAIEELGPGEVLLLENVRMNDSELTIRTPAEHARSPIVRDLAPHLDAYVNDAYSAAHRAHASIVGFPPAIPSYGGPVMEAEYEYNSSVRERSFDGPIAMVLGGTKVDDLVGVMERLVDRVDDFLLGGVIGELFLRAEGAPVGFDAGGEQLYNRQWRRCEDRIRALLDGYPDRIHIPVDLAMEDDDGDRLEVPVDGREKTKPYLDVGRETIETYEPIIHDAAATFVKGALGVFEDERYAYGTVAVLKAIAESEGFSVVGGGDTGRAIEMYGLDEADYDHISLAGGAYLRALTGEPLPAVEALADYRPDSE